MSRVGQLVHIRFFDHSAGIKQEIRPILCNVFGLVTKEDKLHYEITTWAVEECEESQAINNECFCILKGAIVEMTKLNRGAKIRKR